MVEVETIKLTPYEKVKIWRKNNPEKRLEQNRRYNKKHREQLNSYYREYKKNKKESEIV